MGLTHTIALTPSQEPTWAGVLEKFQAANLAPIVRMIDNQPAFPDEIPEADVQEVRLSVPGGMLTIRREQAAEERHWHVIIWGNADSTLQNSWETAAAVLREMSVS